MAFTINKNLVFIDSMQFLNSSLDALVKNNLSQEFIGEFFRLVKQKIVYSYEYIDNFNFFYDNLSDIREVFSSLKDDCISEKDYLHPINVWTMFEMNTMGDYHYLYLKTDALLLTDVF